VVPSCAQSSTRRISHGNLSCTLLHLHILQLFVGTQCINFQMASSDEDPGRVRSIQSLRAVFEQRSDLDAFWLASVDFSKEKVGLTTQFLRRGESRAEHTGSIASLTNERPLSTSTTYTSTALDTIGQRGPESWRNHHLDGTMTVTLHCCWDPRSWMPATAA